MEHTPKTSWLLWAVALFGAYLYVSKTFTGHKAATHQTHAVDGVNITGILEHVLPGILSLLMWVIAAVLLIVIGVTIFRYYMRLRRARNMRVAEIVLGPDDTATPYEVMSALDAIHGQMLTRYGGGAIGQNSFSFEVFRDAEATVHFLIAAPYEWLTAVQDIWRAKYTNIRFQLWRTAPRRWAVTQQIVLTKHWRHATETVKDYQNSVMETMVQALDRADGEVHLQYLLTPIPASAMHTQLRGHVRNMEYQARQKQNEDPASPGVGYADSQAVKDALQLYGKSVFRTEIRLAADTWDAMQRVYGALQEANGENSFRAATVWFAKGLWQQWLYQRMPSYGFFRSNIMFSFPLATIIHLPTARLRVNSLQRALVRRGPAPRVIPRTEDTAIMRDETGLVGIPEGDRKYNVLLIGSQGAGKTTDLLNIVRVDSNYKTRQVDGKALVLIDIGKDTARRALGIVPKDKEVVWFDPSDPNCPWCVNPMLSSLNNDVLADNVLEGLTEVFGTEAIRARSREFLGNAIMAIRDVMQDQADFTQVYQLLTQEDFRTKIIENVQDEHQKQYWQGTFTNTMANNPRFLEEGLAAPRNKLDEVLRNPLIRAALESKNRRQINMIDIVRGRKILIANLDKSKLGKSGARLLGIMLITMVWHALQAQTDIPESERTPVSLVIDEAQNFISEGFLDILAEGRAYGAQVTVAVRFLGEIASEKVIKGLQALAQNLVVHQFELLEEAEIFMKRFMRVFANMITTSDESQDALNFGADDFMRLPKFYAVCRFMVNGTPQQAFLAQTIPWESSYEDTNRDHHLTNQVRMASTKETVSIREQPEASRVADVSTDGAPDPMDGEGGYHLNEPDPLDESEPEAQQTPGAKTESVSDGVTARGLPGLLDLLLGQDAAQQIMAAAQDGLTGLFLRSIWDKAIAQVSDEGYTIMFFDLDGLKSVNDGPGGHDAGDRYIRSAAEVLKKVLRAGDLAARYGGDEFVALLHGLTEQTFPSVGIRIREAFKREGIGISIGAAIQHPGEALHDTLKRADEAMYVDKKRHAVRRQESGHAASKAMAPKQVGVASQGEDQWGDNDARRTFCKRYGITPSKLLSMARDIGVTDKELRDATKWILTNRISPAAARVRLQRILELKVEDRALRPVAERLSTDVNTVRDVILSADTTIEGAIKVVNADSRISTIQHLKEALQHNRTGVL